VCLSTATTNAAIARLSMLATDSTSSATNVVFQRQEEVGVFVINGDKYVTSVSAIGTARTIATTGTDQLADF